MKRTRIKVCGITSVEDAAYVAEVGCDAIGLNFYENSSRFISIQKAQEICSSLPAFLTKVALFVNPDDEYVKEVLNTVSIDTLQFHGNEHPDFCQQFNTTYIKALPFDDSETQNSFREKLTNYHSASSILLDSPDPINFGGTGETFDWGKIPNDARSSIILAGGLNSQNVGSAIKQIAPYAVDVSSGVEQTSEGGEVIKGKKSQGKINDFVKAVSLADRQN